LKFRPWRKVVEMCAAPS